MDSRRAFHICTFERLSVQDEGIPSENIIRYFCASKNDIDPKKLETVDAEDGDPNSLTIFGVTGTVDWEGGVILTATLVLPSLSEPLSSFALVLNSSF